MNEIGAYLSQMPICSTNCSPVNGTVPHRFGKSGTDLLSRQRWAGRISVSCPHARGSNNGLRSEQGDGQGNGMVRAMGWSGQWDGQGKGMVRAIGWSEQRARGAGLVSSSERRERRPRGAASAVSACGQCAGVSPDDMREICGRCREMCQPGMRLVGIPAHGCLEALRRHHLLLPLLLPLLP